MTAQDQTILTCLQVNVRNAATASGREFAVEQLDKWKAHLARKKPVKRESPFSRFEKSLETP